MFSCEQIDPGRRETERQRETGGRERGVVESKLLTERGTQAERDTYRERERDKHGQREREGRERKWAERE